MKLTKEDIGIKKKLNSVMIIAFVAIYALCCFVISPLYAATIADVAYASGMLPVFLSYLDSLLAVLAISVAYSVIILGKYRLGVDKYRCGSVIFVIATVAKYVANMIMTWISDKSIPLSWPWDIFDALFYSALECLQLLIFVLIINKLVGEHLDKESALKKANKTLGNAVTESDPYLFVKVYDKQKCLQRCAMVGALVVLVSKLAGSLINDVWMIIIGGFPTEIITVVLMLAAYLSSIIFGVLSYFVIIVAIPFLAKKYNF